jgi:hypothetical protein
MAIQLASKFISDLFGSGKGEKVTGIKSVVKRTLGLTEDGISLGREIEAVGYRRWKSEESEKSDTGSVVTDDKKLAWHEFRWENPISIDECRWENVRWRFYENGLVCFNASMCNSSGKLDTGDVQGHRIELRDKTGLLLGVWIAGFFVRRELPIRGFQASYIDDHPPLKLHFSKIADVQSGACVCI